MCYSLRSPQVSLDLRKASTKEKSARVLSELRKNAVDVDSNRAKVAAKFVAFGRAAKGSMVVTHIPGTQDTVRYEIQQAKTSRSVCKKSGRIIKKGQVSGHRPYIYETRNSKTRLLSLSFCSFSLLNRF